MHCGMVDSSASGQSQIWSSKMSLLIIILLSIVSLAFAISYYIRYTQLQHVTKQLEAMKVISSDRASMLTNSLNTAKALHEKLAKLEKIINE